MSEYSHVSAVVIGAGSIGRRHVRNLRTLGVENIQVVDPNTSNAQLAVDESGVSVALTISDALKAKPDVVFVCSPPNMHLEHCLTAIRADAHVFVEKPISHNLNGLNDLIQESESRRRIVALGYNLRFIPALIHLHHLVKSPNELGRPLWGRFEFGQYLPDWRPSQDYRESYTARRELGGGIVLDGSHEIDLAMWLFGKPVEVCCMASKLSDLEMDVEDAASILLRFESGAQADIHLDCIQRVYSRSATIAFEQATATWSWPENVLRISKPDAEPYVYEIEREFEPNDMYLDEVRHFLRCLQGPWYTAVPHGKEVVRVAVSALIASECRKWISL